MVQMITVRNLNSKLISNQYPHDKCIFVSLDAPDLPIMEKENASECVKIDYT